MLNWILGGENKVKQLYIRENDDVLILYVKYVVWLISYSFLIGYVFCDRM
jgi:bacteriorhodopsin